MSDETADKKTSSAGWVTGVVVALVLYILAPGPVLLLMTKGVINPDATGQKAFEICFWPLGKLNDNVKPVKKFYEAYFKALGIDFG